MHLDFLSSFDKTALSTVMKISAPSDGTIKP